MHVRIRHGENAAFFVRMEISLNQGFIVVFLFVIVPSEAGKNCVIRHPRDDGDVVQAKGRGVVFIFLGISDFIHSQSRYGSVHEAEMFQLYITDIQRTHLHILRTNSQVQGVVARSERAIQGRVFGNLH